MYRYLGIFLLLAGASTVQGQPPLEIEPSSTAYRLTVINETGQEIRLRFIGYQEGANFLSDMYINGSTTQNFYAGERVVCVWNRSRKLLMAARINVNKEGTLRLRLPTTPVPTTQTYSVEAALPMLDYGN